MKKVLLSLLIALMAIPAFAGIKILGGSFDGIKDQKIVPVVLNWDNAVYGKGGTLQNFLDKAVRDKDWEGESLYYLMQKVNSKTSEYGLRLVPISQAEDAEYYFEIEIDTISKGGDIQGFIYLRKKGTNHHLFTMSFKSDDSDDDDKIAFRDQFSSIGSNLAKILTKALKAKRQK